MQYLRMAYGRTSKSLYPHYSTANKCLKEDGRAKKAILQNKCLFAHSMPVFYRIFANANHSSFVV